MAKHLHKATEDRFLPVASIGLVINMPGFEDGELFMLTIAYRTQMALASCR